VFFSQSKGGFVMNYKKLICVTIAVCLLLSLSSAAKQSSEASGSCKVGDDGRPVSVVLRATDDEEGFLRCTDSDNDTEMYIELEYVVIEDTYAWFAGVCTEDGANLTGRWLFGAVHDGGSPGKLVDHIWWEWLPESDDVEEIAKSKVENLDIPSENKPITSGDIEVTDFD